MAKIRVRALQRGFDGTCRREPGDEFDHDEKRFGKGRWYESVESKREARPKPRSKGKDLA